MEDQLDEELRDRIKKVFDEYEDPSGEEGWTLLRKKYPAKDRRPILPLFWWSAAALLLLALGFGIWKYAGNSQVQNLAVVKKPTPAQPDKLAAAQPAPVKVTQTAPPGTKNTVKHGSAQQTLNQVATTRTQLLPVIPFKPVALSPALQTQTTAQPADQAIASANPKTVNGQAIANQPANKTTDSDKTMATRSSQNQLAANQPATQPMQADNGITANQPKKAASMFADNKVVTTKRDDGPRVRMGVYAASFVNYAKGSINQTNAGAGFSAEIRIAKNLKVVTGLTLAKNSLSYAGGVPTGAAQSNLFAPAGGIGSANPSFLSAASFSSSAAVTVASVPAFQNYGVSMFNIDIPVNLKYDFNLKKTSFYLMAGLSSGTFANETYTYSYNYPALPSPSLQAPHSLSSQRSFDNFYVGKMLNVAFGYGYPIGRNHIILEPFLKYPLGGVGAQNIRLGTGGINLKLNFPTR
jgi:hypothetical protein